MATDTCKSIIKYQNASDNQIEPFRTERNNKALVMYEEGKTEFYPNEMPVMDPPGSYSRGWVDHAAAQEFIDWTISTGLTYNINVIYSAIEDFDAIS
jgi:hypothetical protein